METIDNDELTRVCGAFNFSSILGGVSQIAPAFGPWGALIGGAAGIGASVLGEQEQKKAQEKQEKELRKQQAQMMGGGAPMGGAAGPSAMAPGGGGFGGAGGGSSWDAGGVQVSVSVG